MLCFCCFLIIGIYSFPSFLFLYLCPSSLPLSLFLFYYLYFSLPTHPLLLPQQPQCMSYQPHAIMD